MHCWTHKAPCLADHWKCFKTSYVNFTVLISNVLVSNQGQFHVTLSLFIGIQSTTQASPKMQPNPMETSFPPAFLMRAARTSNLSKRLTAEMLAALQKRPLNTDSKHQATNICDGNMNFHCGKFHQMDGHEDRV